MPPSRDVIRSIDWQSVFPWLVIVRSLGIALRPQLLIVSGICLSATTAGWEYLVPALLGERTAVAAAIPPPSWVRHSPADPSDPEYRTRLFPSVGREWNSERWPTLVGPAQLVAATSALFDQRLNVLRVATVGLCVLWGVAIWAYGAGIITRYAAVDLARQERIGFARAIRWVNRRWATYLAAPLFPLVTIALTAVPIALLGLIARLDLGLLLAGIAWPLAMFAGLFAAILLIGLLVGWPLLWCAASADNSDMFDAVSRTYSYVFQRPLVLTLYAAFAVVTGWLGWLFVDLGARAVIHLAQWSASWGSGVERWDAITMAVAGWQDVDGPGFIGAWLIGCFSNLVRQLPTAYVANLTLVSATAIYLLQRENVDGKDFSDVYLEDGKPIELPPWPGEDAPNPGESAD